MPLKTLMIGSIGIAIAFATPASAQDLPAPHMPEEGDSRSDGIRIAQASNGFQLVEHGLWQSALNSTPSNPEIGAVGRVRLPYRYQPKTGAGPSGFRRASFLPHIYAAEAKYWAGPGAA